MKFQPSVVALFIAGTLASPVPDPQMLAPVALAPPPAVTGPDGQFQPEPLEAAPPSAAPGPDGKVQSQSFEVIPPPSATGPDGLLRPEPVPVEFGQPPNVTDEPFFVGAAGDPNSDPLFEPELVYMAAAGGPESPPVPGVIEPLALEDIEPVALEGIDPIAMEGSQPINLEGIEPVALEGVAPTALEAIFPTYLAAIGPTAVPLAAAGVPLAVSDPPPQDDEDYEYEEECPANSQWTDCGTACPARCFMWPAVYCTSQCVPGCHCQSGYSLNANGDCVSQFGCIIGLFTGGSSGGSFPNLGGSFPSLGSFPNLFGGAS